MSPLTTYETPSKDFKAINEWRPDERPRERLLYHGAHSLRDAELLAILISTGTRGKSAIDLATEMLDRYQSLVELSSRDVSELKSLHGIGQAKAITIVAACELAKRIQSAPFHNRKMITSPGDIAEYFIPRLRGIKQETFNVVLLNAANQVVRMVKVSEGSLNASIAHPREVFRLAITESAAAIILLHNHPSGNTNPSQADITVTKQCTEAGKLLGIEVLDHIIIAGDNFTSMRDAGCF